MFFWGKESKVMAWWYNVFSKGDELIVSSGIFGF